MEYKFENQRIKPIVIQNDDGKFQGMVLVEPEPGRFGEPDRFCVPDTSESYSVALDEAKALAHKMFANKASDFSQPPGAGEG
jgi:hypothetical protein